MWLSANGLENPEDAGAGSYDYMHLMGLTALAACGRGWSRRCWPDRRGERSPDLDAKSTLAEFFNERMLPETAAHWRGERRRRDADGASGGGVRSGRKGSGGPMGSAEAPTRLTGGCQCGAGALWLTGVRAAAICHCRMRQKAGGTRPWPSPGPSAKSAFVFTRGAPATDAVQRLPSGLRHLRHAADLPSDRPGPRLGDDRQSRPAGRSRAHAAIGVESALPWFATCGASGVATEDSVEDGPA